MSEALLNGNTYAVCLTRCQAKRNKYSLNIRLFCIRLYVTKTVCAKETLDILQPEFMLRMLVFLVT
jgi:hypothetical protein